jgi:midasin (ATPase involved in ribosome maturation)
LAISRSLRKTSQPPHIPTAASVLTPVETTLKYVKTIAHSIKLNEPIHLVGLTASAKTSIVRYLAHLTNSGFQRLSLAGQTDTSDLVGQYVSTQIRGQHQWGDGTLLTAMKSGETEHYLPQ